MNNGKILFDAIDLMDDAYINEVYNGDNRIRNLPSKKRLFTFMVAAILMLALLTACAAEVFKWEGRLSQYLTFHNDQHDYLDDMWYTIGESKTNKDITVTIDSAIIDDTTAILLYDITLPFLIPEDTYYYFDIEQMDGQSWLSYGGSTRSEERRVGKEC